MRLRDFKPNFNRNFRKIAARVSGVEPVQVTRVLSSALDWVRPYHLSIGFRVRKLSRSQVEAVIPDRPHNRNAESRIEEGVVISVAQQMARLLLARWEVPATSQLDQLLFSRLQSSAGELVLRLEWEDLGREALRAKLAQTNRAVHDFFIHVYDLEEKHVADVQVTLQVALPDTLTTGKGSHGDHSKRD